MDIGKRIIELREEKMLTTNKLAGLAGIAQSALRSIELNEKSPTIITLDRICAALAITLDDFFTDKTSIFLDIAEKLKTPLAGNEKSSDVFMQLQDDNLFAQVKEAYIPRALKDSTARGNYNAAKVWSHFDKLSETDQITALSTVLSEIIVEDNRVIKIIEQYDSELDQLMEKIKRLEPKERELLSLVVDFFHQSQSK